MDRYKKIPNMYIDSTECFSDSSSNAYTLFTATVLV